MRPDDYNPRSHFSDLASYDHKRDFLRVSLESKSFLHELIHFHDHVSTPYGYFLDNTFGVLTRSYHNLLSLFNLADAPPLPMPLALALNNIDQLATCLRQNAPRGYNIDKCLDYLVAFGALWPPVAALERVLEGFPRIGMLDVDPDHVVAGITFLESLERSTLTCFPETPEEILGLDIDKRGWELPERLTPIGGALDGSRETPIGAAALLESRAFFLELGLGYQPPRPQDGIYFDAIGAIYNALKPHNCSPDEIRDTFLVIADLSLYTPIGRYATLRKKNSWTEVHPGYRLLSLADVARITGPFKSADRIGIFEYQDKLCNELSWVGPREFLVTGAFMKQEDYRERRHRTACRFKLKYPRVFVNAALEYLDYPTDEELTEFENRYMPFTIDPANPQKWMVGAGRRPPEEYARRLTQAYVHSLGWSLLVSQGPHTRKHLDSGFPYQRIIKWEGDGQFDEFLERSLTSNLRFCQAI
jgi:hypothetical protein